MSTLLNYFKKTPVVPVAVVEPTEMDVPEETFEQIIEVLTSVGFFDDSSLRHHMLAIRSYNNSGVLEYTERATGMRFWLRAGANNSFRKISVTKHGFSSVEEEAIVAANRKLAELLR